MSGDRDLTWTTVQMGEEQAMVLGVGGVSSRFGLGPATPTSPPDQRMELVLESLRHELIGIRWGEQIHGRLIASLAPEAASELTGARCVGRCDGLMTAEPGVGLVVWTADCVPVLMAGGGVVAAIHSGWRGAAEDIVGAAVDRFRLEFGVSATRIQAFLGPSISGPHYPVGREVVDALDAFGVDENRWRAGMSVDLRGFLAGRLEALGLDPAAIASVGPCTASTRQLASYRRDGANAGRQFSLVYLAAS